MILVTGATGFLGSRVLDRLVAGQQAVRVFTRGTDDWRGTSVRQLRQMGCDTILADLRDPSRVAQAVQGCDAIINMAGIIRESRQSTFADVIVEGTRNLVSAAEVFGVKRFVHLSCLTGHDRSDFQYAATRAAAEAIVAGGQFHWTILRPSFMWGGGQCKLMDLIAPLVEKPPVVPVVGGGLNMVQPVNVDDVADCVMQCLYNRETAGKTYDLVGPEAYRMLEIVQKLVSIQPRKKAVVTVPTMVALKAASFTGGLMPQVPVSADVVQILISDSVSDPACMLATFAVKHEDFAAYLDSLRPPGDVEAGD